MQYRIYSNYKGWNIIGIKHNVLDVVSTIEEHIYKEKAQYIVIEHNIELDMDVPFKSIANEQEFLEFKEEHKPKVKQK